MGETPMGHVIVVRDDSAGAGWRLADTTVWVRLVDAYEWAERALVGQQWVIVSVGAVVAQPTAPAEDLGGPQRYCTVCGRSHRSAGPCPPAPSAEAYDIVRRMLTLAESDDWNGSCGLDDLLDDARALMDTTGTHHGDDR